MTKTTRGRTIKLPGLDHPIPLARLAVELHKRGGQFYEAFKCLSDDPLPKLPHPAYFLLNHALELLLKAFLVSEGAEPKDLLKLGHNLRRLFEACKQKGLPEVPNLHHLVRHLSHQNSDHDFRYPSFYKLTVPVASECQAVMDGLVDALRPKMLDQQLRALVTSSGSAAAD